MTAPSKTSPLSRDTLITWICFRLQIEPNRINELDLGALHLLYYLYELNLLNIDAWEITLAPPSPPLTIKQRAYILTALKIGLFTSPNFALTKEPANEIRHNPSNSSSSSIPR